VTLSPMTLGLKLTNVSCAGGGVCYFTTEFDNNGIYPLTIDGRATEMKAVSGRFFRLSYVGYSDAAMQAISINPGTGARVTWEVFLPNHDMPDLVQWTDVDGTVVTAPFQPDGVASADPSSSAPTPPASAAASAWS
jgi:hypothetical protein